MLESFCQRGKAARAILPRHSPSALRGDALNLNRSEQTDRLILIAPISTAPPPPVHVDPDGVVLLLHSSVLSAQKIGRFCEKQAEQFRLLTQAKMLFPDCQRLQACHLFRTSVAEQVHVQKVGDKGWLWFQHLQTCRLPFCPVCGPREAYNRRREIVSIARGADSFGYAPYRLTLTARHSSTDDVTALIRGQLDAAKGMASGGAALSSKLKRAGIEYGGLSRVLEYVWNPTTGHNPHTHASLFAAPAPLELVSEIVGNAWAKHGKRAGLDVDSMSANVRPLFTPDGTEDFELVAYQHKDGQRQNPSKDGLTPIELLRAFERGDQHAGQVWLEHARALADTTAHIMQTSGKLKRFRGTV